MIKRFLEIKDSIERHVLAHYRTLASTWLNIFEVEEVERLAIILVAIAGYYIKSEHFLTLLFLNMSISKMKVN
jgi:hypothetical protein